MKILRLKTFGNSMLPFFLDGDILVYKKISFSAINVNDFIIFKNEANFICHRVTYIKNHGAQKYLITKGDNNSFPDKKVEPNKILGKVFEVERKNRKIDVENTYLFQSTLYLHEILNIKRKLEKNLIAFVFLKGLPLHLYFEKKHPRRIYADCDILIDPQYFSKIERIFKGEGYKRSDNSLTETVKKLRDKVSEVTYYKKVQNSFILFDVHLEINFLMPQIGSLGALYPQKLIKQLGNTFLNNRRGILLNGESFPILEINDLVLFLALHLFHHTFRGYYRYEFIHLLLNKGVNFDKLAEEINYFKVKGYVYPVFKLLNKYYKSPIPDSFLNKIKPTSQQLKYINKNVLNINIFEDELRLRAGVERFKHLFFLSPYPNSLKARVFLNPRVINSLVLVFKYRILYRFNDFLKFKIFNKV